MLKNSTLRVLSGEFRGQALESPESSSTHPMGSREKLALFNMINPADKKVLDLYAGSGALGIEALSRGATEVVFNEKSPQISKIITKNLNHIGLGATEMAARGVMPSNRSTIRVLTEDALKTAQRNEFKGYFDLILADPPYDGFSELSRLQEVLDSLGALLAPNGQLVLSSPSSLDPPAIRGVQIVKTRTYAGARLTIYDK